MTSPVASAARPVARPLVLPERSLRALMSGFAWAGLSVAIFSGWFVVTRLGVLHQLRIWDVMALRFGGGALLLLPVLVTSARRLPPRVWLEGLSFALLWGAPFVLFVGFGLQLTSAAQASAITPALMPVFAGLIGWSVLREAPGGARLLGYVAIVGGLSGLVVSTALSAGWPSPIGIGSLVIAAATWAIYTLRFRRSSVTPLQSAALICFWSAVLFLPIYLALGLSRLGNATPHELMFQVIYQGFLMSAVAVVAFNRAVALLGARAAAAIIALLPVVASTMAIPVLGEIPSPLGGAAIAIIALGVFLAARPAPPRKTA
jgi:drug/metabolite transporter (DMT)-like permease